MLYFKYAKMHLKSLMQYKASFILEFITQFIVMFSYFFTISCLFDKFSNIKGFTLYEVLLSFGIIQFGSSMTEIFARGFDEFDKLIIDGSFDRILLKPRSVYFQIFTEEIRFVKLAKVAQALVILVIALVKLDITWDIYKVITFLLMLISSVAIFLGLFILAAAYCFVTLKGLETRNILTDGCKHMAKYPIGIFRKGIVLFLTVIVPFGCVNYYPLLYLLGRETNTLYVLAPLLTLIYLIPVILIFNAGIKKYASTGS